MKIKVDNQHEDFTANVNIWRKCRDAVQGQEAIHAGGQLYLPKLSGQTDSEYKSYLKRTPFYNATQRTLDGMVGLMFYKKPVIKVPSALDEIVELADQFGNELTVFTQNVAEDLMQTGRVGVLVDHPEQMDGITVGQARELNMRPFLAMYGTERIVNWRVDTVNNLKQFTMIVLQESRETWDEFERSTETVYRVLDILEGVYRQRVYVKLKDDWVLESEMWPRKRGITMTSIPFFMVTPEGRTDVVDKPPLLDLVNVNLSHYMTSADLEHAAHFTGLPTPVITGLIAEEGTTYDIGSTTAWTLPDADSKAFFLEFTGQGLGALEQRLQVKERHIATLGARMLADEKAAAETAEAHQIKRQGENSALATIASSISDCMAGALMLAAEWVGANPEEVEFELNKDYLPTTMDATMLQALLLSWQSGAIAYTDLVENMKRGELIDPERDAEEMRAQAAAEAPPMIGLDDGE